MALSMVMSFTACTSESKETEPAVTENTISIESTENIEIPEDRTMEEFIREFATISLETSSDVKEILTKIAESGRLPFDCVVEDIPAEYMPGFKNKAETFTNGAILTPIMSSQPFIVYLFETDDARTLYSELKENVDMRWNICTEATTVVAEEYDNFVLFGLLP